jgi:hypothetical protein
LLDKPRTDLIAAQLHSISKDILQRGSAIEPIQL